MESATTVNISDSAIAHCDERQHVALAGRRAEAKRPGAQPAGGCTHGAKPNRVLPGRQSCAYRVSNHATITTSTRMTSTNVTRDLGSAFIVPSRRPSPEAKRPGIGRRRAGAKRPGIDPRGVPAATPECPGQTLRRARPRCRRPAPVPPASPRWSGPRSQARTATVRRRPTSSGSRPRPQGSCGAPCGGTSGREAPRQPMIASWF